MTMTDRDARRVLVDLSVIAVSAIVLAASYVVVAKVDSQRKPPPKPVAVEIRSAQPAVQPARPVEVVTAPLPPPPPASPGRVHLQPTQPPVRGVRPAPKRRVRRVIVRRRSRAS